MRTSDYAVQKYILKLHYLFLYAIARPPRSYFHWNQVNHTLVNISTLTDNSVTVTDDEDVVVAVLYMGDSDTVVSARCVHLPHTELPGAALQPEQSGRG